MPAPIDHAPDAILDVLRQQIVRGRFGPGDRLPNRSELIRKHRVCSSTLQKAQDALKAEGFLHARRRHGTFVTDHPPHLAHFGLTFDTDSVRGHWWEQSRFLYALEHEAAAISRQQPARQVMPFVDAHDRSSSDSHRRLRELVRDRRLAGLIVTNPYSLAGLIQATDMPCVGFAGTQNPPTPLIIRMDPRRFIDRALDAFRGSGRRRVAMITSSTAPLEKLNHLYRAAAARKLKVRESWVQGVSLQEPRWGRHAVGAVFAGNAGDRPDGLIVADEHLLESVLAGLLDQRLRIPQDVEVIAHASFRWSFESALPVRRLGYVTRDLLLMAIEMICRHNQGEKSPRVQEPELLFDDELTMAGEEDATPDSRRTEKALQGGLSPRNPPRGR